MATVRDTIKLTNEFCNVLTEMERAGIPIDLVELDRLEKETKERVDTLQAEMQLIAEQCMGDTPINLNSDEQLSALMYSRRPKDKKRWMSELGLYPKQNKFEKLTVIRKLSIKRFVWVVKTQTDVVYKTHKQICTACTGLGKVKEDRGKGLRKYNCLTCSGKGIEYAKTDKVGGLRITPKKEYISNAGFAGSKEVVEQLLLTKGINVTARKFITLLTEYRRLKSYLSTNIGGIRDGLIGNVLHTNFNQAVTVTGRLSSTRPNVQNFPRGDTFPIKKVFISKWSDGIVCDADMSQLEFRCAAYLAGDKVAIKEIEAKFDIHLLSASVKFEVPMEEITDVMRTLAKPYTFKPLYGGKDWGLMKRYVGIGAWHQRLIDEVIRTKKLVLPTGREYHFPNVKRTAYGCSQQTKVKNYPVQGFASADVVPSIIIELHNRLKEYKSYIMSTIHDSVIVDIHVDEYDEVIKIVASVMNDGQAILERRFGIKVNVPLTSEVKVGKNAFNTELIA